MSSVVISGDTSGAITLAAPAVAGTNTLTLQAGTATNSMNTLATAVASTSGTSIDFTSIPSWVKRITVIFNGVSTNGSSIIQVQLGDSGGIETTSYSGQAWAASVNSGVVTTGLYTSTLNAAVNTLSGVVQFVLQTGTTWIGTGVLNVTNASNVGYQTMSVKTLSDTLTQVRITTVNGTDTFDAGSVNILYEG